MRKTPAQRQKAYRERNRELVRARDLKRYHRTKHLKERTTKRVQYEAEWREAHRDSVNEYARAYYKKNKGRLLARRREKKRSDPFTAIRERQRGREWYRKNRIGRLAAARMFQAKRNLFYWKLKSLFRCMDCGESRPQCLDFHHRDEKEKRFGIGQSARLVARDVLLEEIRKCDVVCSNCHRIRHQKRREGMLCDTLPIPDDERVRIEGEARAIYEGYIAG